MFITIFVVGCSLCLAIVAIIVAIRSQRSNRKVQFTIITIMLVGITIFLSVRSLRQPSSPPLVSASSVAFSTAAPVPASLTVYFPQLVFDLGAKSTHNDLTALRVKDGATRFDRAYSTTGANFSLSLVLMNAGVIYTEEISDTATTETAVLRARRARDGSELWQRTLTAVRRDLVQVAVSHPIIEDGVLHIESVDNNSKEFIDALSAKDGHEIWRQPLLNLITPAEATVTYDNGIIYITVNQDLYALQASDGHILWQTSPSSFEITHSSIVAGVAYISDERTAVPSLYALRGDTGAVLWQIPDVTVATITNGMVYAVKSAGVFAAYRATDGTLLWQTMGMYVDRYQPNRIQATSDAVYVLGGASSAAGSTAIAAYRATDGALLWRHADSIDWFTVNNDLIYYSGANASRFTALQSQDGSVRWQDNPPTPYTTYTMPTIVDGVVVVVSQQAGGHGLGFGGFAGVGSYLTVLDAATGVVYWRDNIAVSDLVIADVA